jgi:hypothetical protein
MNADRRPPRPRHQPTLRDDDITSVRALPRRSALAVAGAGLSGLAALLAPGGAAAQTTAVPKRVTDPREAGGDIDLPSEGRGPRRGRLSGFADEDRRPVVIIEAPVPGRPPIRRREFEPIDAKGSDGDPGDGEKPQRPPQSDRDTGLNQDPDRRNGANGRGNRRYGRPGVTDSDDYGDNPAEDVPGFGRGTRLRPSFVTDSDEGTLANPGDPPNNGRDFARRG